MQSADLTVRLRNVAFPPRPVTFHLPHTPYCATVGLCSCTTIASGAMRIDPVKRVRVMDARKHRLPGTETVWPRGQTGDLSRPFHPVVLQLDEVKAAIDRGELRVERPTPKDEATASEGPEAPVTETAPDADASAAPAPEEPAPAAPAVAEAHTAGSAGLRRSPKDRQGTRGTDG